MQAAADSARITAVVVTYNRLPWLQQCLQALAQQKPWLNHILLIDNASTDDTGTWVQQQVDWPIPLTYRRLPTNSGGAGGFAAGIAHAYQQDFDWFWLLDDDTLPEPGALAALVRAQVKCPTEQPPQLLASRVEWSDGSIHLMNRVAVHHNGNEATCFDCVQAGLLPIRAASFVSVLISRNAVTTCGLPIADYFLWSDDIEYTARILRRFDGILVPNSIVIHHTAQNYGTLDADPARFYRYVRNHGWLLRYSPAYNRAEKQKIVVAYLWTIVRYLGRGRPFFKRVNAVMYGLLAMLARKPRQVLSMRPGDIR